MPTLAEVLLALITDQPLSAEERREVALHILRLVRLIREAPRLKVQLAQEYADNGTRSLDQ